MGRIICVIGLFVVVDGMKGVKMYEVVCVGEIGFIGEIICFEGDKVVI